jgi:Flp pilus assembly protein TadG
MVEGAIVLSVLALMLFGGLELSLVVVRYNTMSACARSLGRLATLRGSRATVAAPWGPGELSLKANANHPAAQHVAGLLAAVDARDVDILMQWPDNSNESGNRVRVRVSCRHQPVTGIASWCAPRELSATSEMIIEY